MRGRPGPAAGGAGKEGDEGGAGGACGGPAPPLLAGLRGGGMEDGVVGELLGLCLAALCAKGGLSRGASVVRWAP